MTTVQYKLYKCCYTKSHMSMCDVFLILQLKAVSSSTFRSVNDCFRTQILFRKPSENQTGEVFLISKSIREIRLGLCWGSDGLQLYRSPFPPPVSILTPTKLSLVWINFQRSAMQLGQGVRACACDCEDICPWSRFISTGRWWRGD